MDVYWGGPYLDIRWTGEDWYEGGGLLDCWYSVICMETYRIYIGIRRFERTPRVNCGKLACLLAFHITS